MHRDLRDQLQHALSGSITIERELGGGGMSRVFLATDRTLDRAIVIKTLPPEHTSAVGVERFRREIEVAARLQHPHIVALISAGVVDGAPYYTMLFVEGETLRDRLQRGPLPVAEAVQILREVADALVYAHGRGVVHRDIKPENILIANRHALVTDFGVAKAFAAATGGDPASPGGPDITQLGVTVGTPAYMAPEQVSADPAIDHRADLYSLGIVGYEMLVGTPPFHGMAPSKMLAAQVSTPPSPIHQSRPGVPPHLTALLLRCLAKAPPDRPGTAAEVLAELETISAETAPKRQRRGRRAAVIGALATVAVLGLVGLAFPQNVRAAWRLVSRPPAVLRPNIVIVAPLRNETGDPALDHFGDFASNQVADGLMRLTALTVIDGRSAVLNDRIQKDKRLSILSWFRGADRALADETGAGMVVTGAYYLDGNLLRIRAKIKDFATDKIIQPMDEVSGNRDSTQALATKLARRVYGTMAQALDPNITIPFGMFGNPPSLEAYTEMMNGFLAYVTFDTSFVTHYRRAMVLDSEYATPVVLLALGAAFRDRQALAESSVVRAMQLGDKMTPAERVVIDHVRATLRADAREVQRTAQQLLTLVPGSLEVPLQTAGADLSVGDPNAAVAALAHTYPDRGLNLVSQYYWRHLGEAQHQLGKHEIALQTFRAGLARFRSETRLAEWEATELVDVGRDDEIDHAIERGESAAQRLSIAAGAVDALGARGRAAVAKQLAERWLKKLDPPTSESSRAARYDRARLHAAAQQWDSVQAVLKPLVTDQGAVAQVFALRHQRGDLMFRDALTLDAIGAFHMKDAQTVQRADSTLAAVTDPYDYGRATFHRAELAAQQGDGPRTERLLRSAMQKGYGLQFTNWPVERDPYLGALRGTDWFNAIAARARFAH